MGASESLFKPMTQEGLHSDLQALLSKPRLQEAQPPISMPTAGVATARLHAFDLNDAPVLTGLARFPGELVTARTTVALLQAMVGATVVVLHEDGDWARPIVVGVLQQGAGVGAAATPVAPSFDVQADDGRLTLTAEREVVLRCGDASITLTRAGKVILKGNYVVSRSTGYNKIKGAAIDIN